jgi:hypothetical protein
MCCGRRNNQNAYKLAQMLLSRATESPQVVPLGPPQVKQLEPIGPPPAYEAIEQNTTSSFEKQDAFTTRAMSGYTAINVHQDSTSNNQIVPAMSRCAAKRERKGEMRQLKREHRQEKRELRMERRVEKKEMRASRRGAIELLVEGVSNLMKR